MSPVNPPYGGIRSSSAVALAAAAAWLASLFFDAYVPYGESAKAVKGIYLLMFGWLAILGASVAWLANVCLIIALASRKYGGTGFAVGAALFALDALRLQSYPDYGGDKPIYGYGPGVLLWLAAMGLGLVATGMRAREAGPRDAEASRHGWVRNLGVVWLAVLAVGATVLAIKDRMQAASAERERLRAVVFKRNAVCDREPPLVAAARVSPAIVELKGETRGYPFGQASDLLRWGIPVVRDNGRDYSFVGSGADRMVRIKAAQGEPSAVLEYSTQRVQGSASSAIRLRVSAGDGTLVFDGQWRPDGPSYNYCPDYRQLPRADQQPRKVVLELLGLAGSGSPGETDFWATVERVNGKVTAREPAAGAEWINNNAGCPAGIGFSNERAMTNRMPSQSFFVGDTAYLGMGPGAFAVCADRAVYVYNATKSSNDYFVTISRRDLPDLQRLWSVNIKIADADPALQENQTRIVSIAEDRGLLRVRTRHYGHDRLLVLEAPLKPALHAPGGRGR
jgi:hypothetical protein